MDLRKELGEYISNTDFESYFGAGSLSTYIVKYGDIDDYKTIRKLLPKKKDFRIILLESELNSGHWVVLLRDGMTIEYFNSYGLKPSKELEYNSDLVNQQLDQDTKHLDILFKKALKSGFKIVYNKRRFQKMTDEVATCGKHVILRIIMFTEHGLDLRKYTSFFDRLSKEMDLPNDLLVTFVVRKHR
jgi:hypothetical protein